ncbi:unnamed protein product [Amoebophrya sp. A25]|nr:unnamed protein product [Amoebophrya sp. A25]|eukprot:GSA25T00028051001.1
MMKIELASVANDGVEGTRAPQKTRVARRRRQNRIEGQLVLLCWVI